MGVGKTTVCRIMQRKLHNSVFLDGDWCWDANPFRITDETKSMVIENICFLLNQFIHCSAYDNVIFCWVMHNQSIIDAIFDNIDKTACNTKVISLVCSSDALKNRLEKDIFNGLRTADIVARGLERLPLYDRLNTVKIDTDSLSAETVADKIISLQATGHPLI